MPNPYMARVLLEQAQRRTALETVETPEDYSEHSVQELKDAIASRNEDREDADAITVDAPGNKPQLIAALLADDAAQATDENTDKES